ncbi:MAG: RluA family pseudouridine synthase [Rickettsiaceae bacterium]
MHKNYKFIITEHLAQSRLDKILSDFIPDFSRSFIQKSIKHGNAKINDAIIVDVDHKMQENDIVEISLGLNQDETNVLPKKKEIEIVYEDEDVIVVNKQAGLTVHPGAGNYDDTLANALLYHTKQLSYINESTRPGIIHRLDKDTSGLIVVAKNNLAHNLLAEQIANRSFKRKYKALVWGMLKPSQGSISGNIGRSKSNRKKMDVLQIGGKHAITHYQTEQIFYNGLLSLIKCSLETGRTHQIRVHLNHIGHSVVGDTTYGYNKRKINKLGDELKIPLNQLERQALHAYNIEFFHPRTNEQMKFIVPIAKDINDLLLHLAQ